MHQILTPLLLGDLAENQNQKPKRRQPTKTACLEDARKKYKGKGNPNWKGGNVDISCIRCGAVFSVIPSRSKTAKYCSLSCWNLNQAEHPNSPKTKGMRWGTGGTVIKKQCRECSLEFSLFLRMRNLKFFCAEECRKKWISKNKSGINHPSYSHGGKRICKQCENRFTRKNNVKYCSVKCYYKSRRGIKGLGKGKTEIGKLIRSSREYSEWRSLVFQRDLFTCKQCGQVGGKLNAHHIKKFSTDPKLRMFVPNGITLCKKCHDLIKSKEVEYQNHFQEKITTLL